MHIQKTLVSWSRTALKLAGLKLGVDAEGSVTDCALHDLAAASYMCTVVGFDASAESTYMVLKN